MPSTEPPKAHGEETLKLLDRLIRIKESTIVHDWYNLSKAAHEYKVLMYHFCLRICPR